MDATKGSPVTGSGPVRSGVRDPDVWDSRRDPALDREPLVDVVMLAYNVEPFVREAVEGVLRQRTTFPVRIIIAEDRSTDGTLRACRELAGAHPGVVHLIPGASNLGIAGRAAIAWQACRAPYVAICDGDDRWTDPYKLADQVAALEADPSLGLSYTDVRVIDREGRALADDGFDGVRASYREGEVFAHLLTGNFIPNSTVVVRRSLLDDHAIDTDRGYFIHDHLQWLHLSVRARVHHLPRRTTDYRRGGVTGSAAFAANNRRKFREALPASLIAYLGRRGGPSREGLHIILRRSIGALLRRDLSPGVKWRLLSLLPCSVSVILHGAWSRSMVPGATSPRGAVVNDIPA